MENLFLAIIAFNGLLSAVIVGGLLYGMRVVNRRIDGLEAEVEKDVLPRLQELAQVARTVAEATADARRRVGRADAAATARVEQIHSLLGGTLDSVTGVAEQAAGYVGELEAEAEPDRDEEPRGAAR
ncbi:MAG TPA: hypothetical protein VMT87_10100 [Vicinamibacteria bacterium]|nr:hypothetical protein [Vicinamibacteria bacterium]